MSYGKLASTGATGLVGLKVAGVTYPFLALIAAGLVIIGALVLRLHQKSKATR